MIAAVEDSSSHGKKTSGTRGQQAACSSSALTTEAGALNITGNDLTVVADRSERGRRRPAQRQAGCDPGSAATWHGEYHYEEQQEEGVPKTCAFEQQADELTAGGALPCWPGAT
ncbi:hypothetical protein [Azonexus hydrophilus]